MYSSNLKFELRDRRISRRQAKVMHYAFIMIGSYLFALASLFWILAALIG